MKNKNIVFMGTPDFSVPVLKMLIENTNVLLVVTQPDKIVGKDKTVSFNPVKKLALEENIPVFQPMRIRKDFEKLKNLDIDLIVTCAYGQIIPKEVLDMPKYGCINVHASILPKYRGSAPIQWCLFNNDDVTGVTIMYMDEGMDTGDIIKIKEIPILDSDNVGTLHDKLSKLGCDLLLEVLPTIFDKTNDRIKQGNNYTMAPMIKREDERLDFNEEGKKIIGKIKGLNPWPLANIIINNQEIKVLEAEFVQKKVDNTGIIKEIDKKNLGITCKDGIIYLKKIKPSGKKVMEINSFLNGIDKEKYLNMEVNNEG
ncbi:MAG: methionyl-tRNA formyltransferase [Firmicutes bacterium]|nr:methionyl-tRNA formyltransferase [Bacillota bacterium]